MEFSLIIIAYNIFNRIISVILLTSCQILDERREDGKWYLIDGHEILLITETDFI